MDRFGAFWCILVPCPPACEIIGLFGCEIVWGHERTQDKAKTNYPGLAIDCYWPGHKNQGTCRAKFAQQGSVETSSIYSILRRDRDCQEPSCAKNTPQRPIIVPSSHIVRQVAPLCLFWCWRRTNHKFASGQGRNLHRIQIGTTCTELTQILAVMMHLMEHLMIQRSDRLWIMPDWLSVCTLQDKIGWFDLVSSKMLQDEDQPSSSTPKSFLLHYTPLQS